MPREQRPDPVDEHAEREGLPPTHDVAHPAEEEAADERGQPLRGDRADDGRRGDLEGACDVHQRIAQEVELHAVEHRGEEREEEGEPHDPAGERRRVGGAAARLDRRH
jgi:hypothetical protein